MDGVTVSSLAVTNDAASQAFTFTSVTDPINVNNLQQTTAAGFGPVGDTISVVASNGTNSTSGSSTTVIQDGTWTVNDIDTSSLHDGTIIYTATDEETGSSATLTATKDTVSQTFALTSVTDPINVTNFRDTTAQGTGTAGDTISVVASDGTNSTSGNSTIVIQGGTWTVNDIDTSSLHDGTIIYTATDEETGSSATLTATKDTAAQTFALTSVTDPINVTNFRDTTAQGTGTAGDTISVVASDGTNSTSGNSTIVIQGGTWTVNDIDTSSLHDGTIIYTATDEETGSSATLTATKDTAALAVTVTSASQPNLANEIDATISGVGNAGTTVTVTATDSANPPHGVTSGTVPVTATGTGTSDGNWTVSSLDVSSLQDGIITYTVTETDTTTGHTVQSSVTRIKDTVPQPGWTTLATPIPAGNAERGFVVGWQRDGT